MYNFHVFVIYTIYSIYHLPTNVHFLQGFSFKFIIYGYVYRKSLEDIICIYACSGNSTAHTLNVYT